MTSSTQSSATGNPPRPILLWIALIVVGITWGTTGPLAKLAISTGHHPIGVTFWNTALGAIALAVLMMATRRPLPLSRRHLVFFLFCGFLGTAFPNSLNYAAFQHLPVGVIMIIISLVPMATLVMAVPMGLEKAGPARLAGLGLGILAVLLIALPEASLPDTEQAGWIILPVIVALSYAAENVYIARSRPDDCDALTTMCGLVWGAFILLIPTTLASGAWFSILPLGVPEVAIVAISGLHICAYLGFIWLIGQAGPVFASQIGYIVTATGMVGGMIVFGERHSPWIWAALGLMFAGLALVKPKS